MAKIVDAIINNVLPLIAGYGLGGMKGLGVAATILFVIKFACNWGLDD